MNATSSKRGFLIRQRVPEITKRLLELDRKLYGGSEGDALDRLVLRGSQHPEAVRTMLEEARKDAKQSILLDVVALQEKRALKGGNKRG